MISPFFQSVQSADFLYLLVFRGCIWLGRETTNKHQQIKCRPILAVYFNQSITSTLILHYVYFICMVSFAISFELHLR